mmetsp:Transcript_6161/g.17686  ORF Transcript_6161/g.17686 Transcript_6161/m.17686 type:complete len:335 (-) Transcript_6161:2519-3523(-)|eukprot:CAMPEP_0206140116 /NCGR_PEP_ID=MMETSP1473-20131121/8364_1 /ASSEMBLY_ACC=CAM_ASM_001109 /TAXON_ID=1461547 /ORGANISM="Stichococcus sp, Strain RCC1054" /LENGTH=334 /DNA_ID=CAMNT_0053534133 /DNA_START=80 /DNA_END=1084 /DNA_ORIENTATION=+
MMDDLFNLGRILLQEGEVVEDECAQPNDDQSAHRSLRIGGLFIIMAVTSCGLIIPLISKGYSSLFFLARTFGAGVILSTALIHILPDAAGDLSNPCLRLSTEYPWAFAIAGMVLMMTFAMEYCIGTYLRHRYGGSAPITHGAHAEASDIEAIKHDDPEKVEARRLLNATVASYTLEAGVILHSIFVGLAYGASTDLNTIRALTIALGFHQGIEGISLGCTFIDAKYGRLKYFLFAAAYVIVTPIGIAIGLGIGNTYHEGSRAALGTQGTLNAVSAGILIYNGIVDLIIPAFLGHGHAHGDTAAPTTVRPSWLTAAGFFSLVLGYCVQSLIGKWA